MSKGKKTWVEVCSDLGIQFDEDEFQEWGLFHSNPNRLQEFVAYYERYSPFESDATYALSQLIFVSANELMQSKIEPPRSFAVFLRRYGSEFDVDFEHWTNLAGSSPSEVYPLSNWLAEKFG
jgi:hypothetical protein